MDALNLALRAQDTARSFQMQYQYGIGYPLTVLIGAVFVFIFKLFNVHDPVIAVNFMNVVFSSLSVCLFYLFIKRILDRSTAFFSSLTLAFCPLFLAMSLYGRGQILGYFFLIAGLIFLLKHQKTGVSSYLALSGISFGWMGACRLQDLGLMAVPVSFAYFFPTSSNRNPEVRQYILFIFVIFLSCGLFYVPALFQKTGVFFTGQIVRFFNNNITYNARFPSIESLVYGFNILNENVTIIGLFMAFIGLCGMIRTKQARTLGFLGLWYLVPVIFYSHLYTRVPRFIMLGIFPAIIAIGHAWAQFDQRYSKNIKIRAGFIILFILMLAIPFHHIYPVLKLRHDHDFMKEYVHWVKENIEENAMVIDIDRGEAYQYFGGIMTLGKPYELPNKKVGREELFAFKEKLDGYLSQNISIYITDAGLYAYDYFQNFRRFMFEQYHLEEIAEHGYVDYNSGETNFLQAKIRLYKVYKK